MNNKSKTNFFAAVVLRALLLILPVSACATAEERQEMGAPQMMESIVKGCFGAVMSPDGKRIYILREGQLIQYQFNPFKKLGSIAVETAQVKSMQYDRYCTIGLTKNESKLIFVSQIDISLFDAKTGKFLKNVRAEELGRPYSYYEFSHPSFEKRLTFNGDDLVIMFDTRIAVLDANTFAYKHKEIDIRKKCGFEDNHYLKSFKNIAGRLYFISPRNVAMLNGETYECELLAKISDVLNEQQISRDFQTLVLKGVTELRDFLRSGPARYDDMKKDDVLLFDLNTRTASVKQDNVPIPGISIYNLRSSTLQEDGHTFFRLKYVDSKHSNSLMARIGMVNERERNFFAISTYEGGEAILMEAFPEFKFGNFQMTPGARKYLMMKNSEGKVVPMNDATFNKYYRAAFEN